MNNTKYILLLIFSTLCLVTECYAAKSHRDRLSLTGQWNFELGRSREDLSKSPLADKIRLPGTTDTNKKGDKNTNNTQTTYLSREYSYVGEAWYSKEVVIPSSWRDKEIELILERTKATTVWIDGRKVDSCNHISTPQRYNLTAILTPGRHTITIMVDNSENRLPKQILGNSHACTESTQTNWNGIIGNIELAAKNKINISAVKITPNAKTRRAKVEVFFQGMDNLPIDTKLTIKAKSWNGVKKHSVKPNSAVVAHGSKSICLYLDMGENALLWSEFEPYLYNLEVTLHGYDNHTETFALRDFATSGSHFTINGQKTYLRGKHDACVFPLTAHVPMNIEEWQRYFQICKEYGINHVRFHSWCPPKACFDAADIEGIYLQPELPYWGSMKKENAKLINFLKQEGINIQNEYSNHASFVMFALGNELSGEFDVMQELISTFRNIDARHLYAYGSNNFLGTKGQLEGEDFLVTCRVGSGDNYQTHVRGSFSFADALQGGIINNTYPNSSINFDSALKDTTIPVISHETGQFQVYPNYNEMDKYTGVLKPINFQVFKDRLQQAGMESKAEEFFFASGKWSVELYKADIEMDLRTERMAGFQLLDLQDYPGQGSSYVGILDAFMDSKRLVTPDTWRGFCNSVVPLLLVPKFCWSNDQTLSAEIKIANYGGQPIVGKKIKWTLTGVSEGVKAIDSNATGLISVDNINIDLSGVKKAAKLRFEIAIAETDYKNGYDIWVYPSQNMVEPSNVEVVKDSISENLVGKLTPGNTVVWFVLKSSCRELTVDGLFQTDYWNYRMFKNICDRIGKSASPGTMGLLVDPEHPLFEGFPTDIHTNWQWYSIVKNSFPMILDNMPNGYYPIVQVIDNVERNHKLGLVYELDVNGAKLLICLSDISHEMDKPEVLQFYKSLVNYAGSNKFNPQTKLTVAQLKSLFGSSITQGKIDELKNISYE